jgi:hypothetical protein
MRTTKAILGYILFSFALGGCFIIPTAPVAETVAAAIVSPIDGEQLEAGKWVDIQTLVFHPSGVTSVVLLVDGVEVRQDQLNIGMQQGNMYQPWQPLEPGVYTLQVRANGSAGELESNKITVIVGEAQTPFEEEAPQPAVEQDPETPTFTQPPTLTATFTPTQGPKPATATANQDANCRTGPGPVYEVVSALPTGQSSLILGQNNAASWLLIERQGSSGGSCWVWSDLVSTTGDLSLVSIVAAPPTPTHTPSHTPAPTYTPTIKPTITETPTVDPCIISPSSCFTVSP